MAEAKVEIADNAQIEMFSSIIAANQLCLWEYIDTFVTFIN